MMAHVHENPDNDTAFVLHKLIHLAQLRDHAVSLLHHDAKSASELRTS
jgi:hypothetical protein